MRDTEKHLVGAVTLLEDITHLREIDRLKSEFIATASHELRTPLTSVQMGVHLLLEGAAGELNDKQTEVLGACREDCERLDKLMRDLLDLSKIEAGESQPELHSVKARELIMDEVETLRPQVEAKGLSFVVDIPIDLPRVLADRSQVERVVANLVVNAIRYTRQGEIRINAEVLGHFVAVSVSDTGKAYPRNTCPISSTSLCRSPALLPVAPGWAWRFPVLSLKPMAVRSVSSQRWDTVRPSLLLFRLPLSDEEFVMPERVLIVDDEENIRQMLRLTLETADYEVGEAGDGMEAFAILGGEPAWNVILLDQRLPIMEGTEVLRRIKVWPLRPA